MSGGALNIDSAQLRTTASTVGGIVGELPQHSLVDLNGCGSAQVAQAASQFDLWVVLTGRIDTERVEALRDDANAVADEIDRIDAELAAGSGV